nr:hypothetical protein [Tanacetum cinerariifolium]
MNTTQAQQKALDDAFVAPADRLEFEKGNMRLKTDIKPKEATFQVALYALALTSFYQAFLITVKIFPKIPRQQLEDLPLEHEILSFIRDLRHTGDIHYLTDIENKETKKTNKMLYPRFTKVIIDYFMIRDPSRKRRNKIFWHTARDNIMFTTMRCISRHEQTQVYGVILPHHLTSQAMLESEAYKTYYAYASGEKYPKPKYVQKKADSDTSPKKKPAQATKGTKLKSLAKVVVSDKKKQLAKMPKTKGIVILSEVALTKAEQLMLATKRSKTQFHGSHASGSCNGVDTQSKVLDEQQQKVSGTNEGDGVRPEALDVPQYNLESDEESWTFSQGEEDADEETDLNDDSEETESDNDEDDLTHPNLSTYKVDDEEEEEEEEETYDEEMSSDQRVSTPPEYELTKEAKENKEGDDEDMEGEHVQDEQVDLYRDVNINLERSNAKMTDAQANQDTKDSHVTLTPVPPVAQQQSSSISSDLVSKFIIPSLNTDSTMKTIIKEQVQAQVFKIMPKIEKEVEMIKTRMKTPMLDQTEGRREGDQEKKLSKSAYAEEHGQKVDDLEDQTHQEFNTGNDDVTHIREALDDDKSQWNPSSSLTPDREWYKTKTVENRPPQPWITQIAQAAGT